jgi:hypothetical protein
MEPANLPRALFMGPLKTHPATPATGIETGRARPKFITGLSVLNGHDIKTYIIYIIR